MKTKNYLFAVQDETGREIVSATVEVEKVSEVYALLEDGQVSLQQKGILLEGPEYISEGTELTLYRWDADDKVNGGFVSHKVHT